jgi:hypothetical protein
MKVLNGYIRKNLGGQNYILPVGQRIVQRNRCLKINASGVMIWDYICDSGKTPDEVFEYMRHNIPEKEVPSKQLRDDIYEFLHILSMRGMLDMSEDTTGNADFDKTLCIAGINIFYYGKLKWLHKNLLDFTYTEKSITEASMSQRWEIKNLRELEPYQGKMIIISRQMDIYEVSDGFYLRFNACEHLLSCFISLDGKKAVFYYDNSDSEKGIEELFCGFRVAYLYCAMINGRFALHSASLLYSDKVWLFSAPSGTGKSTHVELWKKVFDIQAFNGDLNLLCIEEGKAYVYGIPWCGTSNVYHTGKYEAGGIFLLKRSDTDYVEQLSRDEQQLYLAQRFVSPSWNEKMVSEGLSFAEKFSDKIPVCSLYCTKKESAAVTVKYFIDGIERDRG